MARARAFTRADLSTLGMEANRAALTDGDEWLDQLLVYLDGNHDLAESYLKNVPGVNYTKAQGTYLAWLDVNGLMEKVGAREKAAEENETSESVVTPEQVLQRWFAENARIYLNPGHSYGTGGSGRMRMNLATSRVLVKKALDNLGEAVANA